VLLLATLVWPVRHGRADGPACGPAIRGAAQLLRPGLNVLLGEIHGTEQVPRFLGDLACRAAAAGLAVVVLLEIPADEDPAFARYLASAGRAADRTRLLAGAFWRSPYPDGWSSRAMAGLLEQLRRLRAGGAQVAVAGLIDGNPARDGDAGMADRLIARRRQHPEALLLALAGNNHTRIADWPEGPQSRAMGQHLRDAHLPALVSLTMADAGGRFFGISGATGVHAVEGTDRGRQRFIELTTEAGPFDGRFYVGRLTASLPAVPAPRTARIDKEMAPDKR
jgi:hypothetical protein